MAMVAVGVRLLPALMGQVTVAAAALRAVIVGQRVAMVSSSLPIGLRKFH